MAKFMDLPFETLVKGMPKVLWTGATGTETMVLPLPGVNGRPAKDKALVLYMNSRGKVLNSWTIVAGGWYRLTPGKCKRMPAIDADPDPVRRFCRLNDLPLTCIRRVDRGEEVRFEHPLHQGDSGIRVVRAEDPPVKWVMCETTQNPQKQWMILVVKGEEPKTYEEFAAIACGWPWVQDRPDPDYGYWRL